MRLYHIFFILTFVAISIALTSSRIEGVNPLPSPSRSTTASPTPTSLVGSIVSQSSAITTIANNTSTPAINISSLAPGHDVTLKKFVPPDTCGMCEYTRSGKKIIYKNLSNANGNNSKPLTIEEIEEIGEYCCDNDVDGHNSRLKFISKETILKNVNVVRFSSSAPTRGLPPTNAPPKFDLKFYKKPPRCIPLVSSNPLGNPYHPLLVNKDSNAREVKGFPVIMGTGIDCPQGHGDCKISITQSRTFGTSFSYSISSSQSSSMSNSMGETISNTEENSVANSVSETMERSWSHTATNEQHGSVSDQVSTTLTKTSELSIGYSKTNTIEGSSTSTESRETNYSDTESGDLGFQFSKGGEKGQTVTDSGDEQKCDSQEGTWNVGGNAGINLGFVQFGAQGGYSNTTGTNKCNTKGHSEANTNTQNWNSMISGNNGWSKQRGGSNGISNSVTNGHSESDTVDTRRSDSVSDALTNSKTVESGWSSSQSDTVGNSYSRTHGSTNTYSKSKTLSQEVSKTIQTAQSIEKGEEKGINESESLSFSFEFPIKEGTCRIPVYKPIVKAVAIPWACRDDKGKTIVLHTDVIDFRSYDSKKSVTSHIPCTEEDYTLQVTNDEYNTREETGELPNAFASGQVWNPGKRITSTDKKFTMELERSGNLVVKRYTETIWQTGTDYLKDYDTRARINEKGHLILEAKGIFSEVEYRDDDYVTVWSTQPKYLNFTAGVFGEGYSLIIAKRTGRVTLYDGVGSPIWDTRKEGYKHPEEYNMPTDMITPSSDYGYDKHNAIDPKVKILEKISLLSRDNDCAAAQMEQNTGLVSPNKRFKFILTENGNLLFKDGTRTMWSSRTSDLWFAKAPYIMFLNHRGEIVVRDSNGYYVWQTANVNLDSKGPFELKVEDEGKISIYDKDENLIWSSWQGESKSLFLMFKEPVIYCYPKCDKCKEKSEGDQNFLINKITGKCLNMNNANLNMVEFKDCKTKWGKKLTTNDKNCIRKVNDKAVIGDYDDKNPPDEVVLDNDALTFAQKCLTVKDTTVNYQECGINNDQLWIFSDSEIKPIASNNHFPLINQDNNKCAGMEKNSFIISRSSITLQECDNNNRWVYDNSYLRFKNNLDLCLNVKPNGAGSPTHLINCNEATKWKMENGDVKPANINMCLDNSGGNNSLGNKLQIWDCNGSSAQKWNKEPTQPPPPQTPKPQKPIGDPNESHTCYKANNKSWPCKGISSCPFCWQRENDGSWSCYDKKDGKCPWGGMRDTSAICYHGGDIHAPCYNNCPPCWKRESSGLIGCYNKLNNGKCHEQGMYVDGENSKRLEEQLEL